MGYVVDVLAKKWQIPAVIPLIASGLGLNVLLHQLSYSLDWLNSTLPVLGFGLMLNNVELFCRVPKLNRFLSPQIENIVVEFKPHVSEIEFGVRSLFFIMLGLWTPLSALSDYRACLLSVSIVGILLIFRILILKFLKQDLVPLVWLAPRGLTTVLLILTAMDHLELGSFPQGAVMLTVLLTCLLVVLARPKPVRQLN